MADLRTASVFSRRCLRRRLRWLAVLGPAVVSLLYCWPGHPSAHGLVWPDVAANEQGALTTYAGAERVLEQMLTVYAQADLFAVCDFLPPEQRARVFVFPGRVAGVHRGQLGPFCRGRTGGWLVAGRKRRACV